MTGAPVKSGGNRQTALTFRGHVCPQQIFDLRGYFLRIIISRNIRYLDPRPTQSAHDRDRDQPANSEPGCPDPVGNRRGDTMRDQHAAQS